MNPMSIIQTMMNQMKVKMPQNFQTINALMQNKNNPQDLVNQIMSNLNQEQKQNLLSQMKQYRLSEWFVKQITKYEIGNNP